MVVNVPNVRVKCHLKIEGEIRFGKKHKVTDVCIFVDTNVCTWFNFRKHRLNPVTSQVK